MVEVFRVGVNPNKLPGRFIPAGPRGQGHRLAARDGAAHLYSLFPPGRACIVSGVTDFQRFHRLAERQIDPVLDAVADENKDRDSSYIVEVAINPSIFRTRCLLTIKNRDVNKPPLRGSFLVAQGASPDTVQVTRSSPGASPDAVTLQHDEVTQERLGSIAREFVDEIVLAENVALTKGTVRNFPGWTPLNENPNPPPRRWCPLSDQGAQPAHRMRALRPPLRHL
jgi:hypothetical protein